MPDQGNGVSLITAEWLMAPTIAELLQ